MKPSLMNLNKTSVLAAAVAATLGLAGFAQADVSEHIPAEALLFVKVNDLRGTSDRFAAMAQDFGLAAFQPDMNDPLGAVMNEAGIREGLSENGNAALYVMPPTGEDDNDPDDNVVVLLPVSDFNAFVGNFEAGEEMDGMREGMKSVQMGNDSWAVIQRGDYAALSQDMNYLNADLGEGLSVADQSGDAVTEQDMVLYANFKKLGPLLTKEIDDNQEEGIEEFRDELEGNEQLAELAPIAEAGFRQLMMAGKSFLRDTEAATIGVTFAEAGIRAQVKADFAADSYLGRTMGSLSNSDASLLAGLPEGQPYLVYGGSTIDAEKMKTIYADLLAPITKAARGAEGEKSQMLAEMLAGAPDAVSKVEGYSFGMFAPQGDLGGEPMIQSVAVIRGDGDALAKLVQDSAKYQREFMKAFAQPGQEMPVGEATIEEGAKELAGVSLTKITSDLPPGPATMIYGPEGATSYYGTIDNGLVQMSGLSDQRMTEALEAAREGRDPLAGMAPVQETAGELPADRVAAVYFALDQFVITLGDVAQQFGAPVQVQLPPDLPPVGATVASGDGTFGVEVFLPSDTLQAVIAQGMQTYMQMQGGGGAGGPGGL